MKLGEPESESSDPIIRSWAAMVRWAGHRTSSVWLVPMGNRRTSPASRRIGTFWRSDFPALLLCRSGTEIHNTRDRRSLNRRLLQPCDRLLARTSAKSWWASGFTLDLWNHRVKHCWGLCESRSHRPYPFATVSVFRAKSSDRQQYQLATEAYGRHGSAIVWLISLPGRSSSPY